MKIFRKSLITLVLASLFLSAFAYLLLYKSKFNKEIQNDSIFSSNELNTLKVKASQLKQFAAVHHCNKELCFLADMSIPSGKNRFFIYDLKKDSVLLYGLVAHGSCDKGFQLNPSFSNTMNCGCSSLGKYKIGSKYKGSFGLSYKLHGLDSSNRNAFARSIVLHSYYCVPEKETDPFPICNSRGCPMISPAFLQKLEPLVDHSKKPMLLWIFK